MVEAYWSGAYPCLCSGQWTLKVNGEDMSDKIPEYLRTSDMNTDGTYQRWWFDEDYNVEYEDYQSGLDCEEWIESNKEWLDTITTDHETQREIYYEISAEDFRGGSCGGCI